VTISKLNHFNGVYHYCMYPYSLGQHLDREATISDCKAVTITAWATWTLAFRKYNAKVVCAVSIREVDRTIRSRIFAQSRA
jgi:hypothetical protein